VQVHRASWMIHHGAIPEGMFVCHHCDTPSCVNPAHLFLGTAKDNMQDCAKKGRLAVASGERNSSAKLTDQQAEEIRTSPSSVKTLAMLYGVSIWTVYDIRSGRSRQHSTKEGNR
jgi:hypothetical protein